MAVKLGNNTNIYKYGSRRNIEYIFTKDHMFGLEVINSSLDSYYLYVNIDATIDPSSPLGKFIAEGFIIKVGENDDFRSKPQDDAMELDEENGFIDDLDSPIMLQYQKNASEYDDIPGGYYKYRFHRPLLDLRYDEDDKRLPDSEDALNENDCLNFGECSTAKYMGLDQKNVQTFPYRYQASVLEAKENGAPFGISDEENMQLLKTIPSNKKDNYAVPTPGECYAMVRKEYRESVMYHIAFCIYSYNGVNITLEANADNGREYLPAFGFYDTNPSGFTFYKRYISIYDNGETIVLKGRNINDILKEINEEVLEQNASMQLDPIIEQTTEIGGKRNYKKSNSGKSRKKKSTKIKKGNKIKTKRRQPLRKKHK